MPLDFVTDFQRCHRLAVDLLAGPDPGFLARIGGSDTDAVVDYFAAIQAGSPSQIVRERVLRHTDIIAQFNGYYDKDRSDAKVLRFCTEMLSLYKRCSRLSICQADWLTTFFPESIHPSFHVSAGDKEQIYRDLLKSIADRQRDVSLLPYPYIERVVEGQWTLFRAFAETLSGRRVLVVSPFARGGHVFSEVSDHTSQLRFLEERFGVPVPNLSAWRRETTSDLTRSLHLPTSVPGLPVLPATSLDAAVMERECTAGEQIELNSSTSPDLVPRRQVMPSQEA